MNKFFSLCRFLLILPFSLSLPLEAVTVAQCPRLGEEVCQPHATSQKKDWQDGWNNNQKEKNDNQHNERCQRERFVREITTFITCEAGLTKEEAQKFFPVFFEMREKQHILERQKAKALRLAAAHNPSDRECARVLDEIERFNQKSLRIETSYTKRLEKLIGARKLVKVLSADRKFARRMFHERRGKKIKRAVRVVRPATPAHS
ncbi:MAG: hypothetical protein ACLS29_06575 [Prevotellamassilia sp.]